MRQSYYSVPARFIGRKVRVSLRANELMVFERHQVVARHPRLTRRYHYRDDLDHYLEILMVRPGALAGSTGLAAARAAGTFTEAHETFWSAARVAHGEAAGTRALIEVLLLHRRMPVEAVLAGIRAALQAGTSSPELVAIEARKAKPARDGLLDDEVLAEIAERTGATGAPDSTLELTESSGQNDTNVITLPVGGQRTRPLPEDSRPLPSVAVYDRLLRLRTSKGTA